MYCPEPTEESHSIVAHDDSHERVIISFFLRSVTSLFHTFIVEADEFERHDCPRVELTLSQLTWDPSSTIFEDQENITINYKGEILCPGGERKLLMVIDQVTTSTTVEAADIMSIDNFAKALEANVNISHVKV